MGLPNIRNKDFSGVNLGLPLYNQNLNQELLKTDYLSKSILPNYTTHILPNYFNQTEHASGNAKFNVFWSVTYGVNKKLINPKILKIEHIENLWEV